MAYLLDPGEGKYASRISRCGSSRSSCTSPDREEGTLDLDGDVGVEQTGRRAVAVLRLAAALAEALEARELAELYERIERPLVRVLAQMERRASASTATSSTSCGTELSEAVRAPRAARSTRTPASSST